MWHVQLVNWSRMLPPPGSWLALLVSLLPHTSELHPLHSLTLHAAFTCQPALPVLQLRDKITFVLGALPGR